MVAPNFRLIGRGVYTVAEAARLARVHTRYLHRWTQGYEYRYRGKPKKLPPILGTTLGRVGGAPALDFQDLVEVRFLEAFRTYGVKMATIRVAALRARELTGRLHPFSSQRFMTDGQYILMEVAPGTEDEAFLELVHDQLEFKKVVAPSLHATLVFTNDGTAERWYPLGVDRVVCVDPRRAFGAPIIDDFAVPTRVLAHSVVAEGSVRAAAWWYEVPETSVQDAVDFERSLV